MGVSDVLSIRPRPTPLLGGSRVTLPLDTIRYRKPTRRQIALMAMGIQVRLTQFQEPVREITYSPLPPPVHFQPEPPSAEEIALQEEKRRLFAEQKGREAVERDLRIAKMVGMPAETWRNLIQEDLKRFREGTYIPPVTHRIVPIKKKPKRKETAPLPVFARKLNNKRPLFPDYSQFYGPTWKEVQAAAMVRSKGKCEICKRRKARQVHHVLPIRYFVNSEDAHFLENTLALCIPCHQEEHRKIKVSMPLLNQLDYRW